LRRVVTATTLWVSANVLAGVGLDWLRSFAALRMTSSAGLSFAEAGLLVRFCLVPSWFVVLRIQSVRAAAIFR
jgi:hypothetical protein